MCDESLPLLMNKSRQRTKNDIAMRSITLFLSCVIIMATRSSGFVSQPLQKRHQGTALNLDIGSMIKHFGKKVKVSHILVGPPSSKTGRGMKQDDAIKKLEELKVEIDNDPVKFAEIAKEHSSCRASLEQGGDLGEYGPGMFVGPFDKVCFEEDVGVVHGPVSTPFGEHLILVRERTGN